MVNSVEIIDLHQVRQPECRVQICQLHSSDFDWRLENGLHILDYNEKVSTKIMALLNVSKQNSVDLIIFPELAIPLKFIEKIQEWSNEHGLIVIAGSHYYKQGDEFISRSPIIINGEVYFTEKISPSPLEKSPINGEGLSRGNNIKIFKNTAFGNIGILICSDYLDEEIKGLLNLQDLDILCVPAFQKDSNLYESRMNIDCENSKNGLYILYSNFCDKKFGDGKSSVFGIMDKLFSEKFKEKSLTDLNPRNKLIQLNEIDDYVIFDISLEHKRPFINRNVNTGSNVLFISKSSWLNSISVDFAKKIAHDDERYKRIDEYFVEPMEYNEIVSSIEKNNLVFLIGDPGIGKTYTAVKILKNYFEKGYDPIWFAGLEKEERDMQVKQLANFSPTDNQVVYFEDPFGRTVFERKDTLFQVFSPLIEKLSQFNSKIIITSRKEVFEKFSAESLLEKDVLSLRKELNVRNPSYDKRKLTEIFDKLAAVYCEWYSEENFRQIVYNQINSNHIRTPLAIRDIVFASRHIKKIEELVEKIEKKETEIVKAFALEILGVTNATKIFLYLVFLGGYKGHNILSEKFKEIVSVIKEQMPNLVAYSFNIELRSQVGYRIEQLGRIKTFYRFSHPVYEESLAMLATTDSISELIIKASILNFAKDNVKSAFQIINKFVLKYSDLSLILFKHLFENDHILEDDALKILLTQKLISVYYNTKDLAYFKLAESFYPLDKLVDDINSNSDIKKLADRLNLVQRYKRNSPLDFDHSYSERIDFKSIFETQLRNIIAPHKPFQILFEAATIDSSIISLFLESYSPYLITKTYFILNKGERKRFFNLLPESKIKRDIHRIQKKVEKEAKEGHGLRDVDRFRVLLFSDYLYDGEIFIDSGAEEAIKKRWANLLPVGIIDTSNDFDIGVMVAVKNRHNQILGVGLTEYSSNDLKIIRGHSSNEFYELLSHYNGSAAIRANAFLRFFKKPHESIKWKRRT